MLVDLQNHRPEKIEFALSEAHKEMFKDVLTIFHGAASSDECIQVLKEKFNVLFPDGEVVERKYDKYEISAIREEYCVKQEEDAPKRKEELELVLAQIKMMKKNAEDAYNSILLEIAELAARVKNGTCDFLLPSSQTARLALNGHYLTYAWVDNEFKLAKVEKIPDWDRNGLWAQEDFNRIAMKDVFGIDFPEIQKPVENNDEMPFEEE